MAKTGVPMHAERMAGGLFSALLFRMANKLPPNERVKVKRERKRGTPPKKDDLTDEQVAEARRAYEAKEAGPTALAAQYGVSCNRMNAILNYRTRSARLQFPA